ncbi:MAG TPA: protein-L-isoaspartate(D-aspartate) O-methyltransferase [Thermotogota bacterium]|nr:protein-L-isoaspartate(D-aspartate) O-methyltransferase [Thermotogota bacterium]
MIPFGRGDHFGISLKEITDFQKTIDRSLFVDNDQAKFANDDRPLPIGYGQTISQPSLVAFMTFSLELSRRETVLEIGTGSGYQTCLLTEFSSQVYTVELIQALSSQAQDRLQRLGYENCQFKIDDGSQGWQAFAPFDRIICTSAASKVPDPLIDQLAIEGIMIIPVGPPMVQNLYKIRKKDDQTFQQEILEQVRFVEFKGKYGWN